MCGNFANFSNDFFWDKKKTKRLKIKVRKKLCHPPITPSLTSALPTHSKNLIFRVEEIRVGNQACLERKRRQIVRKRKTPVLPPTYPYSVDPTFFGSQGKTLKHCGTAPRRDALVLKI